MGTSVFSTTPNTGIAVDQTVELVRIAVALETVAANSTTIANNLTTIANKITEIETYQKRMKELGEGPGIRMVGPYEWLAFISSYVNYVEKGEILNIEGKVSAEKIAEALAELETYFNKVNSLPTNF